MRVLHDGPVLLRFHGRLTPPVERLASDLWTVDGSRVAYLTRDWRHALGLGERVGEATYEVVDERWPPGTLVTVEPVDVPRWWDERAQPDQDLWGLLQR